MFLSFFCSTRVPDVSNSPHDGEELASDEIQMQTTFSLHRQSGG